MLFWLLTRKRSIFGSSQSSIRELLLRCLDVISLASIKVTSVPKSLSYPGPPWAAGQAPCRTWFDTSYHWGWTDCSHPERKSARSVHNKQIISKIKISITIILSSDYTNLLISKAKTQFYNEHTNITAFILIKNFLSYFPCRTLPFTCWLLKPPKRLQSEVCQGYFRILMFHVQKLFMSFWTIQLISIF